MQNHLDGKSEPPAGPAPPKPPPAPPAPGNPFTPGNVVPPERFIGRRRELAAILARVENMLSVSLVGEARIGKSSLLRYLAANLRARPDQPWRYLAISLSMDSQHDVPNFCKAILVRLLPQIVPPAGQEQALRALERRLDSGLPPTLDDLARALELAKQTNLRVVLLLDEFRDLLDRPESFDLTFRGTLRSFYTNQLLALVLATRQPLTEIDGLNAYFANGISQQELELLTSAEAEQLLRQPHDRTFSAEEVRLGLDAGRRHPLRLQSAGFYLYEWKGQIPGPLYEQPGMLSDRAPALLAHEVQREYDQAMAASRPVASRARGSPIAALGRIVMRVGETADTVQAWMLGAFIIIAVIVVIALLIMFVTGILTLDQLGELLRRLTGGS